MDRAYWDSLAETFDEDLLEIACEGDAHTLEAEIAALAGPGLRVADLGCGPGSLLPFLAKAFGEVVAVDYSEALLAVARRRCRARHVSYRCHDLSGTERLGLAAEVVCCINALIDPDREKRERMAEAVARATARGGTAVVVVPALESVFHVYHSLRRCRVREGKGSGLEAGEAERLLRGEVISFTDGIVRVGGVATKYWMRAEIAQALGDRGLVPRRVRRIEYPWTEEIEEPPAWLGEPYPWDWLVAAEKVE